MSFTFANLPGVQVDTVDGGLAAVNTPTTQAVMVFGTSAIGPANSPYQVISLATAAKTFGLNGTLVRGMSEVSAYCDNITLFRVGANQGTITIGATGSGSESVGTMAYAVSNAAGTVYTYTTIGLGADIVPGALVTTTDFIPMAFNITGLPVVSTNSVTNSFTVAISPAVIPSGGLESFVLAASPSASIVANLATVYATNIVGQVINVGDSITIASATSATLDIVGGIVLSATLTTGVWKVTYTSPTATLAPTSQIAGTLVDNNNIAATVQGTGTAAISANAGTTISLGQIDTTANTRYSIWYDGGIVTLWLDNVVVLSNDPAINVNTGDSQLSGAAVGGLALNNAVSGNPDTLANAITLQAATALSTVGVDLAPTYVSPISGIGLTSRQLYIAQQNAMNLAQGLPIDIVVTPGAYVDNPNVAFYVSSNSATAANNPVTNSNALDWLWTGTDVNGSPIYQWASEAQFWTSNNQAVSTATLLRQSSPTTPVAHANTFTSSTVRLGAGVGSSNLQPSGFHEVSFAYQLARFSAAQSEAPQADNGGCMGFIGTNGPAVENNFSLSAVKNWIGYLPTYGVNGTG